MPPCVLFRVDASKNLGFGHLSRCLSFAEEIRNAGGHCEFACQILNGNGIDRVKSHGFRVHLITSMKDIGLEDFSFSDSIEWPVSVMKSDSYSTNDILRNGCFNWVVVDHYAISELWQLEIDTSIKLAVFDDFPVRKHRCDILIDASPEREAEEYYQFVPTNCKCCVGIRFAVIQPKFFRFRKKVPPNLNSKKPVRIFINFGATDQLQITPGVVSNLINNPALANAIFFVVAGDNSYANDELKNLCARFQNKIFLYIDPKNLPQIMRGCDFAIGAGGVSALERCAIGLPSVIVPLAKNQLKLAESLHNLEVAVSCSLHNKDNFYDDLSNAIDIMLDNKKIHRLWKKSEKLLDGQGVRRLVHLLN